MSVQRKASKLEAVLDDADQAAKLGIHSEAIKLYRRVLKERPSHVEANAGLDLCLKALGQFAEAEQPLKRAATLAPTSAQAQCDAVSRADVAFWHKADMPRADLIVRYLHE